MPKALGRTKEKWFPFDEWEPQDEQFIYLNGDDTEEAEDGSFFYQDGEVRAHQTDFRIIPPEEIKTWRPKSPRCFRPFHNHTCGGRR